ncbi:MAG: Na+/H+ antiporter NhaC family protein [Myxococcota bacterium]
MSALFLVFSRKRIFVTCPASTVRLRVPRPFATFGLWLSLVGCGCAADGPPEQDGAYEEEQARKETILSSQSARARGIHPEDLVSLEAPPAVLSGIPFDLDLSPVALGQIAARIPSLRLQDSAPIPYRVLVSEGDSDGPHPTHARSLLEGELQWNGALQWSEEREVRLRGLVIERMGPSELWLELDGRHVAQMHTRVLPAAVSIVPPILAILLALLLRQVVIALFAGVWIGAFLISGAQLFASFFRVADTYAVQALADSDHASILIFSLLLGSMIGVISRSGGTAGLADFVVNYAKSPRLGQVLTWLMGIVVFFDDYANALLVGSSMRPITDRLRISREKLAFLVDGTAATVSSIAVVSSWIGVEIAYIADQFDALGIERNAYLVFLESIPFRFYPILMLFFALLVAAGRRDFGPMLAAERRARDEGKVVAGEAQTTAECEHVEHPEREATAVIARSGRVSLALAPVMVVMLTAAVSMYVTGLESAGQEASLREILGQANSYSSLLWAALLGSGTSIIFALRVLSFRATMDAWLSGVRSMTLACVILVLAWSLGAVCRELHTAYYLVESLSGIVSVKLLPALVFVIGAGVSFATGTSWGTMAILFPVVVPMAHEFAPGDSLVLVGSISSILSGAVFGDHCSPISDTTVMSSMATGCDHLDHVSTQLPYALLVGAVSLIFGDLGVGFGWYSSWVGLLLGAATLVILMRIFGRKV